MLINILLSILVAFYGISTCLISYAYSKLKIKLDPFKLAVQKLIMCGNVPRAFKFCQDLEPPVAKATILLLERFNRPHSLELAYQEGLCKITKLEASNARKYFVTSFLGTSGLVALCFLTYIIQDKDWLTGALLVLLWVFFLTQRGLLFNLSLNLANSVDTLTEIRNTVYDAQGYVPPQYTPGKMSSEQVAEQKTRMEAFEKEMTEGRDVLVAFKEKTNGTGILPPL